MINEVRISPCGCDGLRISRVIVEMFGLQGPESYAYTSRSNCLDVPGIDDAKDFRDTIVRIYHPLLE